jgi:hypothetical protein
LCQSTWPFISHKKMPAKAGIFLCEMNITTVK